MARDNVRSNRMKVPKNRVGDVKAASDEATARAGRIATGIANPRVEKTGLTVRTERDAKTDPAVKAERNAKMDREIMTGPVARNAGIEAKGSARR